MAHVARPVQNETMEVAWTQEFPRLGLLRGEGGRAEAPSRSADPPPLRSDPVTSGPRRGLAWASQALRFIQPLLACAPSKGVPATHRKSMHGQPAQVTAAAAAHWGRLTIAPSGRPAAQPFRAAPPVPPSCFLSRSHRVACRLQSLAAPALFNTGLMGRSLALLLVACVAGTAHAAISPPCEGITKIAGCIECMSASKACYLCHRDRWPVYNTTTGKMTAVGGVGRRRSQPCFTRSCLQRAAGFLPPHVLPRRVMAPWEDLGAETGTGAPLAGTGAARHRRATCLGSSS